MPEFGVIPSILIPSALGAIFYYVGRPYLEHWNRASHSRAENLYKDNVGVYPHPSRSREQIEYANGIFLKKLVSKSF